MRVLQIRLTGCRELHLTPVSPLHSQPPDQEGSQHVSAPTREGLGFSAPSTIPCGEQALALSCSRLWVPVPEKEPVHESTVKRMPGEVPSAARASWKDPPRVPWSLVRHPPPNPGLLGNTRTLALIPIHSNNSS